MSRLDVHHHFYPEVFTRALERAGGDPSGWSIPPWTLEADQQLARDIGVKTAILSVTTPGPCIEKDPKAAAKLARAVNEAGAAIRDQYPSLLHQEEALEELAYAFDHLNADGAILFTRYGEDNHYFGHPEFRTIWAELNKRRAVVFVHPTHAVDIHLVNSHLPQPMFDYPHETGRTAIDMILSNTMHLVKDCKIILSHAGSTLPYLIDRVAGMIPHTQFTTNKSTTGITEDAKQLYFETALSSSQLVLDHLLGFAKDGHVLFGSDFPNAPTDGIEYFTRNLDDHVSETGKQVRVLY
ncbi:amidohydrolase family protein [Cadophora sp. MPI-SDFR-AT-0126]|nr:amidohydrolase family protein [Leotiomycetes sp. MPI-SDFR-AT-0126]